MKKKGSLAASQMKSPITLHHTKLMKNELKKMFNIIQIRQAMLLHFTKANVLKTI